MLVPFVGGEHDWAGLELAAWLASSSGAPLLLAGVSGDVEGGRRDASRLLGVASMMVQGLVGVVAEPLLVASGAEGLLEAAAEAGVSCFPSPTTGARAGSGRRASRPPGVRTSRSCSYGAACAQAAWRRRTG